MSQLIEPSQAYLFTSIIFHQEYFDDRSLIQLWSDKFGVGESLQTDYNPSLPYYAKEMGETDKLTRFIYCSFKLHPRSTFLEAKKWATTYENEHRVDGKRTVNIDIGILNLENLLLATGKNYSHRVYLGAGIFADLTYQFQNAHYQGFPWTYPDYLEPQKVLFFEQMRQHLLKMQKQT